MLTRYPSNCHPGPHWHIVTVREYALENAPMDHGVIDVVVLDSEGCPAPGIDVVMYGAAVSIVSTATNGVAELNLFDPCSPPGTGPNTVTIVSEPADEVTGLGLPEGQRVKIEVLFRWTS